MAAQGRERQEKKNYTALFYAITESTESGPFCNV